MLWGNQWKCTSQWISCMFSSTVSPFLLLFHRWFSLNLIYLCCCFCKFATFLFGFLLLTIWYLWLWRPSRHNISRFQAFLTQDKICCASCMCYNPLSLFFCLLLAVVGSSPSVCSGATWPWPWSWWSWQVFSPLTPSWQSSSWKWYVHCLLIIWFLFQRN